MAPTSDAVAAEEEEEEGVKENAADLGALSAAGPAECVVPLKLKVFLESPADPLVEDLVSTWVAKFNGADNFSIVAGVAEDLLEPDAAVKENLADDGFLSSVVVVENEPELVENGLALEDVKDTPAGEDDEGAEAVELAAEGSGDREGIAST